MMRVLLPILALLTMVGCVSHHWMAPAVSGTVIDAKTKNPIEAVEVFRVPRAGKAVQAATTTVNGSFHMDATGNLVFWFPFGDPAYLGHYSFRKAGYVDGRIGYAVITGEVVRKEPPRLPDVLLELIPK